MSQTTLYIYFILFSDKLVELVAGLGHVQAGVAAGTVDEPQDTNHVTCDT